MGVEGLMVMPEQLPVPVTTALGVVVVGGLVSVVVSLVGGRVVRSIIQQVPHDTVLSARFGLRGPQTVVVVRGPSSAGGAENSTAVPRYADWQEFVKVNHDEIVKQAQISCSVYGLSTDGVKDVVQDAVIGLERSWRRAQRAAGGPESYMRGIIRNKACNARYPRRRNEQLNQHAERIDDGFADSLSSRYSTEDQVLLAADIQVLRSAIGKLPERQREIILLEISGLSAQETATELGISPGAVRQARCKAMKRLRKSLDDDRREKPR